MLRPTLALLLLSTCVPAFAQNAPVTTAEQPSRAFSGADLFGLEMASSPQISRAAVPELPMSSTSEGSARPPIPRPATRQRPGPSAGSSRSFP